MTTKRLREYNIVKKMLKRKGEPLEELFFSDEMGIRLSEAHQSSFGWDLGRRSKLKTLLEISNLIVGEQYPKMAQQPFIYSKTI